MAFKRARAEASCGFAMAPMIQESVLENTEHVQDNAKKYRRLLIEKYLEGSFPASDVALLAYYHTESGGQGCEDLALHPSQCSKHAAEHLRRHSLFSSPVLSKQPTILLLQLPTRLIQVFVILTDLRCHLRKEYPEPTVEWIRVPMFAKKSLGREVFHHPTRVTSDMIREELRSLGLLGPEMDSLQDHGTLEEDAELGDRFFKHPVTIEARNDGLPWEHIVPLSVYFDGVQYTNNDSFLGFYCTNLRTKKQRLVWLLRYWILVRTTFYCLLLPERVYPI